MGILRLGPATLGAIALLTGPVLGQGEDPPLRGPEVVATRAPGVHAEYAPREAGAGDRQRALPAHVFFGAVRGLRAETAPAGVTLSPEQAERINAERRAFAAEVEAYVTSVHPEVEMLVAELPRADRRRAWREWAAITRAAGAGERPDSDWRGEADRRERARDTTADEGHEGDEGGFRLSFRSRPPAPPAGFGSMDAADESMAPMPESPDEIRARLVELRGAAPSAGLLQTRLWAVLTPEQQRHLEHELASYRERARADAEERRLERYLAERRNEAASPSDRALSDVAVPDDETIARIVRRVRAGERPEWLWSRLPERARERLDRLTSEERAQAVARLLRAHPGAGDRRNDDAPE